MKNSKIVALTLSDVHLGHRRTPTSHIVKNIRTLVPNSPEMKDVDIIFISGDLFDRNISLSSDDTFDILEILGYLLKVCKKYDIVFRLLEGTPSHDWRQAKILDAVNNLIDQDIDAKWINTLCIEYIEKLGINVLYIPDEWNSDNDVTWKDVQRTLHESSLEQVDFTIMHGQFPYQLPAHVKANTHLPERYQSITKLLCFCGHVHIHSRCGNIVVPGSLDRLTHNEEHPKGIIKSISYADGHSDVEFIENTNAMKYITVDCCGLALDDALVKVDSIVSTLPLGSHVRIQANKNDPIAAALQTLGSQHTNIVWTTKIIDDEQKVKETLIDKRAKLASVPINPRTVVNLVEEELRKSVDASEIPACLTALRSAING